MSSLHPIRTARPDIPDATEEAREDARRRLLEAMAATPKPVDAADHEGPGTLVVVDEVSSDVVHPPARPARRQRGVRWLGAAASIVALTVGGVAVRSSTTQPPDLDVVAAPEGATGDAIPQVADEVAPGFPAPKPRAPFGTYETFTETVHNWDDTGGTGYVSAPEEPGPWPIVIVLFHPDVAAADTTTAPTAHLQAMQPVAELLASAGVQAATMPWSEVTDPDVEAREAQGANIACFVANARTWGRRQNGDTSRVTVFAQGAATAAAVDAVVRDVDRRAGCNGWNEARPDLVVSIGADVGPLDGLPADAAENTHIPFLFLDGPGDPAPHPGGAADMAASLAALGYTANHVEIEGLGRGAWAPSHQPTRDALDRLVDAAHAVPR